MAENKIKQWTRKEIENRLMLGDCLDILPYIPNNSFDLLIFDWPYNLKKDFPNDNLTPRDFRDKLRKWVQLMYPKLNKNGSFYNFMGYDYYDYLKLLLSKYLIFKRDLIWHYIDGGDKLDVKNYIAEFDKVLYFVNSENYTFNKTRREPSKYSLERWKNHCDEHGIIKWEKLSKDQKRRWHSKTDYLKKGGFNLFKGKSQGNVFIIPRVNNLSKERIRNKTGKKIPTTQKPEALIKIFIETSSNKGDLIGDFFMGSGTTCAVAKKLGRKYFGCEIRPELFEMAKNRINSINIFENITNYTNNSKDKNLTNYLGDINSRY